MTPDEIRIEKNYRYHERLGIMCGSDDPAPQQIALARKEAEEWEMKYQDNDQDEP